MCFCVAPGINLPTLLVLPLIIRSTLLCATLLHGLGHVLATGRHITCGLGDYLGARPWACLMPFSPAFIPGISPASHAPRLPLRGLSAPRRRLIALAGPAANALAVCALLPSAIRLGSPVDTTGLFLVSLLIWNAAALLTSWTDFATAWGGVGQAVFCGNFGILAKRAPDDRGYLPKRFLRLVEQLGEDTDIRGQQAGGMAVLAAGGHFIGRKILNEKRGNLTRNLVRAFGRSAALSRAGGIKPLPHVFHLVAHYRYATAGGPSLVETHWHRWMPPRTPWVWRIDGAIITRNRRNVSNLITHNGDFDAWQAPRGRLSNEQLGAWLTEVLGHACRARGDSPKIAGMMDLLVTEGQWDASLRLAYAMETGLGIPAPALKELAGIFDEVFRLWTTDDRAAASDRGGLLKVAGRTSLADVFLMNGPAIDNLRHTLHQASLTCTRDWPDDAKRRRQKIVSDAVDAFFHNDLLKAAMLFMARAQGTFGLVTSSSLHPGEVVLCAERQPMFIGADPCAGVLLYASESAALKNATYPGPGRDPVPLPYRYDLRDGDIVRLQVKEGTADSILTHVDRDGRVDVERITVEALEGSAQARPHGGWISMRANPYMTRPSADTPHARRADDVLTEMSDIPRVLEQVRDDWQNGASLNRRTAAAFSNHLFGLACEGQAGVGHHCQHRHRGPSLNLDLDLLVLGIENNLSLGERFVEDLHRVFPFLHAEAVDAIAFCEDPARRAIGRGTITLALSQSGQTFNSLDAVKFLVALHELGKAGPVFVLTGEVDTLMGAAVGQGVKAHADWNERVFTNGAGWRTAEPATVSSAATHATLTQLLMRLMVDAQACCTPDCRPFGLIASDRSVRRLDALARLTITRSAAIFGRTAEGWAVTSPVREQLLAEGRYLTRILIEPALVFIATALHLFLMLWLGWNPVIGLHQTFHEITGSTPVGAGSHLDGFALVAAQTTYFLFFGVVFAMVLRAWQKRPLWDRFFVARTLVIGETSWVKDLLAQYVSKLFSLAYEFAGFGGIHAADAGSGELLHGYGHRVTRGLILFLGIPDGRRTGRERAEAAVCMTASQVQGVQSMEAGPTVIGIGHNPALASRFNRFVDLDMPTPAGGATPATNGHDDWSQLTRDLQASRFTSFERLMASYVIFHSAAAGTRDFMNRIVPLANLCWWPIFFLIRVLTLGRIRLAFRRWDLARTQSGTRIATTAAPVSAINLDPRSFLDPVLRQVADEEAGRHTDRDAFPTTSAAAPPGARVAEDGHVPLRRREVRGAAGIALNTLAKDIH